MADPPSNRRRAHSASSNDEEDHSNATPLHDIRSIGSSHRQRPNSSTPLQHHQRSANDDNDDNNSVSSGSKERAYRSATPSWGIPALVIVWLLNAALIVSIVYALMNWAAFTWIIGSAAWATFLEILVVIMVLYLACAGCCLLGFETRIRDSYLQLRNHRQCRLLSTLAAPVFIIAVFTLLALLALAPISASNSYVQLHASEVFTAADLKHDGHLTEAEFAAYLLSLPAYSSYKNNTLFMSEISHIFDALDTNGDTYLEANELYAGILSALTPARKRFGYSVAAIGGIALLFMCLYTCWYRRLEEDKIELEPDDFLLPFGDREVSDDESESGHLMNSAHAARTLRHPAADDDDRESSSGEAEDFEEAAPSAAAVPVAAGRRNNNDDDGEGDVAIDMDEGDDGHGAYDHDAADHGLDDDQE